MAMKKTGDAVKAVVFSGEEAVVLNEHLQKQGKALSDFTDKQREALDSDLEAVRPKAEESKSDSPSE